MPLRMHMVIAADYGVIKSVGCSIHQKQSKETSMKRALGAGGTQITIWRMLSIWPSYYNAHFDLHIAVVLKLIVN